MKRAKNIRLWLVAIWLLLTLSLSSWWMIYGMRQASLMTGSTGAEAIRLQRMFFWEGSFLLLFVTIGGGSLAWLIYKDQRRYEEVRRFFSTFTHELKTSLTSLRLQAEILEEDPKNRENENLRRLLRDVVRLELQLENSLILAQADTGKLFLEDLSLKKILQHLSHHWPHLKVEVKNDAKVKGDQRAFECIVRNILQNASVHGDAGKVTVSAVDKNGMVEIIFSDDGKGFPGDPSHLGEIFRRHTTKSGSGLGLHLARILAKRMNGRIDFKNSSPSGMEVHLELGGRLV